MGNYEQENYKKKAGTNDDDEDSSVFDDGDHSRSRRVSFGKNESLLFRSDTNVESLRSEAASVAESYPQDDANVVSHGHVGSDDGSDQDEVSSQAASFCDSVISDAMKEVGLTGRSGPSSTVGENAPTKRRGSELENHQVGSVESSVDLEYSRKNSTTSSQTGSRIQSARHRNNGNETDSPSSGIYRLEHENSVISPTNHKDGDKNAEKDTDKNAGKNDDKNDDKNDEKNDDKSGKKEVGEVKKAALRKVNKKHGAHEKGSVDGALGGAMDGSTSHNEDDDEEDSEDGDSDQEDGASSGQIRKKSKRMKSLKHVKIEADKDLVVQGGCCVY